MKQLLSLIVLILLFSCTPQNTNSKYSKIEYEAGPCFGFCPIFKLTINPDKTATLEAERFNFSKDPSKDDSSKPREGTFKATIKEADYHQLISLRIGCKKFKKQLWKS